MKIRFDPPEERLPDRDRGVKVDYGSARRTAVRWRWYLVLFIVASPLVYFLLTLLQSVVFIEADGYIQLEQIKVHSLTKGHIEEVFVEAQDTVESGQTIVKISDLALANHHRRLTDEIQSLSLEKEQVEGENEIGVVRDRVAFANSQRRYYEKRWRNYESLFRQGAVTEAELNTARAQYEDALNTAMLQGVESEGIAAVLRQMDLRLRDLNLELAYINDQRNLQVVTAPRKAKVTEVFVHQGEYVVAGTPIAHLVSQDLVQLLVFLPPRFSDYARVGQKATVRFPNGETRQAHVSEVPELTRRLPTDSSNVFAKRPLMILAKMEFDEPIVEALPDGLPVTIRFHYAWE